MTKYKVQTHTLFKKVLLYFKTFLFPPICIACFEDCGSWLCNFCKENISYVFQKHRYENINFPIYTIFQNTRVLRSIIYALKYKFYSDSFHLIHPYIVKCIQENIINDYVFIPIPLHSSRRKERGFNQSKLLLGDLPLLEIKRIKKTKSQSKLNKKERFYNMENAFVCRHTLDENICYIIFDDVVTTANTLSSAAQCLREAGAKKIIGLALSRGL